jgi:hypothetical protein
MDGNSGIAGHRDGFFRRLKDIGRGDAIEIVTLRGKEVYHVERVWIVSPEDVSVLLGNTNRTGQRAEKHAANDPIRPPEPEQRQYRGFLTARNASSNLRAGARGTVSASMVSIGWTY